MKNIQIDVTKIKKEKLRNGKYLDLVIFDLKDGDKPKTKQDGTTIKGNGKTLYVSGLVKQNGDKGEELPILGDETYWKQENEVKEVEYPSDDINPQDIPF